VKPASYDRLAQLYNVHLCRFSQRTLPVLERLVLSRLPARARILDVCCGTGQLAALLSQRGYEVTGIDESEEMLQLARGNAPSAAFVVADVRTFESALRFSAAFSTHDSMNHMLSISDLRSAFTRVHDVLLGVGVFAFDLNMEPVFVARWNGCLRTESQHEICEIIASWDADTRYGYNNVQFFRRDGTRTAHIMIVEKCFSETEVRGALEQAGFGTVASYDAQIDLGMDGELGRAFFVAERL